MEKRTGACMCGSVKFEMEGPFTAAVSCHCKGCQRLHGIYNPLAIIDKDKVTITGDTLRWYDSSEEKDRGFCAHCGSAMFMRQKKGPKMLISVGCIDDTSGIANIKNVFAEEAGEYYVMPPATD